MLAELENKGVSLDVVYELSRVLDLQKIAKELSVRTDRWSNMGVGSVPNTSVSTQGVNNGNDGNSLGRNGGNTGYNHIDISFMNPVIPHLREQMWSRRI